MKRLLVLRSVLAVLVLCLAGGGCHREQTEANKQASAGEASPWLTNFDTALTQVQAEKKILLLDFTGSDWCPPCIMLQREILSQPAFLDYARQHLVLLEVDFPRMKEQSAEQKAANEKLADRYGIVGFPTVILLDPNGKPIGELGYRRGGPDAFIAAIEKARSGS